MAQLKDSLITGSLRVTDTTYTTDLVVTGSKTARYALIAPTSNGAPTWRALTNADVGLGNVENTKLSTWTGSTSITTLGTIGTGTWNATKIALKYGGTGADGTATAINTVFAGPSSGSAGNASFRSLVAADLPTVPVSKGGTGMTSFTADSLIMSGNTTTAALTTRAITDRTSVSSLTNVDTWAASTNIPTVNLIAYWDGRYQKTNNLSNLTYLNKRINFPTITGGTGVTASDLGESANPRYRPASWKFNAGIAPIDGDVITVKKPSALHDYGTWLSLDNGTTWYPIVYANTSRLPDWFSNNYSITLRFDAVGTCSVFGSIDTTNHAITATNARSTITGVWRLWTMYDSGAPYGIRVYRQTSGYNGDYPLLVSRTAASGIGTAGTNSSYTNNIYGVIWNDTTKIPTLNPSTGAMKIPGGITGNVTGNVTGNCSGSSGSCTGNAATATSTQRLARIADNTAGTDTNVFSTDGLNVRWYEQTGKISGQPTQYGFLFTVAMGAGSNELHQLWAEQRNGSLYHRGTNGDTHASPPAFKTILDSSNYTSYTVTKTGSGASGTWGISITGSSASCTGNAATATEGKWLMNRGGTTVTIADSSWAIQKTPSGHTNRATVFKQKWSQSGLTYTPSGGSATAVGDTADFALWLSSSNTANALQLNMQLDGLIYAMGGFIGNVTGNCSGSSGSCTGNAATCTTANGLASLVTASRANHSADTGVIVENTDSTNPLKIGYIIGKGGNAGIYDFTHSVWKIQIAPDGTTTFSGDVTGSSGSCTGNAVTATTATVLSPTGADSFTSNSSGNFKHKRSTNTDYWSLLNSAGTEKFKFYWETGNATFTQDLTCRQIYLNAYGGTYGTGGQACFWYNGDSGVTASGESASRARVDKAFQATKVYNAVWNDYAECRQVETEEPGYCVTESSSGIMIKTTERLQAGCKITSDTFGTCMGETSTARTPIAVAGRVLVYPYRDRKEYELGAAVCSAPNGTIDIMTRDEIMMYPERIIGTVSEIPSYDIWHCGEHGKDEIKVNGRIWIYVR